MEFSEYGTQARQCGQRVSGHLYKSPALEAAKHRHRRRSRAQRTDWIALAKDVSLHDPVKYTPRQPPPPNTARSLQSQMRTTASSFDLEIPLFSTNEFGTMHASGAVSARAAIETIHEDDDIEPLLAVPQAPPSYGGPSHEYRASSPHGLEKPHGGAWMALSSRRERELMEAHQNSLLQAQGHLPKVTHYQEPKIKGVNIAIRLPPLPTILPPAQSAKDVILRDRLSSRGVVVRRWEETQSCQNEKERLLAAKRYEKVQRRRAAQKKKKKIHEDVDPFAADSAPRRPPRPFAVAAFAVLFIFVVKRFKRAREKQSHESFRDAVSLVDIVRKAKKSNLELNRLTSFLLEVPFFKKLKPSMVRRLCQVGKLESYKADEKVFWEGDVGNTFYTIISGAVAIATFLYSSQEHKVRMEALLQRLRLCHASVKKWKDEIWNLQIQMRYLRVNEEGGAFLSILIQECKELNAAQDRKVAQRHQSSSLQRLSTSQQHAQSQSGGADLTGSSAPSKKGSPVKPPPAAIGGALSSLASDSHKVPLRGEAGDADGTNSPFFDSTKLSGSTKLPSPDKFSASLRLSASGRLMTPKNGRSPPNSDDEDGVVFDSTEALALSFNFDRAKIRHVLTSAKLMSWELEGLIPQCFDDDARAVVLRYLQANHELGRELEKSHEVEDEIRSVATTQVSFRILKEMQRGDSFGEIAMETEDCQRTATVIARVETHLMAVSRQNYTSILRQELHAQYKQESEMFLLLPALSHWRLESVVKLRRFCGTVNYSFATSVMKQGEVMESILILRSGSLRVVRSIPVAKTDKSSAFVHKRQPKRYIKLELVVLPAPAVIGVTSAVSASECTESAFVDSNVADFFFIYKTEIAKRFDATTLRKLLHYDRLQRDHFDMRAEELLASKAELLH